MIPLGSRGVGSIRLGLVAAALLLAVASTEGADWEKLSDKAGLLVERRPVAGSQAYEVRVTARSPVSPAAIFNTLWNHREYSLFIPHLKHLDILSDTGNERVVYEQVAIPLARDRDYTVRLQKRVDATAQRYEILFVAENEAGPPPDGRHVRVQHIRGSWTVEPEADGKGSLLRYALFTEPGGAIPAWMANRAQRETAADLVAAVLKRARENEIARLKRAPDQGGQK